MEVELIAYTPNPENVCGVAAKTCTSEEMPSDGSGNALKHAISSGHLSVCEHASFTFTVSGVSRALTHQLVRHRVASYSQQSQRYVNMDNFEYVTPESIRNCPNSLEHYEWGMKAIQKVYNTMIAYGITEEDARYILPNACCTNIIVSMNARELLHFFAMRTCSRAQTEIRELADKMLELVKPVAPIIFENAGPQCKKLGYCPEKKGCGRYLSKGVLSNVDIKWE